MGRQSKTAAGKRFRIALMGALILAMGLVFNATPPAAASDKMDKHVRSEMLVSTHWLAEHLKDPKVVVLCVSGSLGFYYEGHIPGTRWINLADIVTKRGDVPNELPPVEQLIQVFRAAGITEQSRIILYGENYNLLAARAYFTLDYLGLAEHAALLDGGLDKWKNELRPLSKDVPKNEAASANGFTVSVNSHVLVEMPEIKYISRAASTQSSTPPLLIDARPLEEYTGERHSQDVHKLGHIPGATHLYWQDLLVSRENPVLLPPKMLRQKFRDVGSLTPTETVVTYCRSGMQSSFDYFVAKYLGYDARMYDASFFEWSMEDLPAEVSK